MRDTTLVSQERLFEGFCLSREAVRVSPRTLACYRLTFSALARFLPLEKLDDLRLRSSEDLLHWARDLAGHGPVSATCDQRIAKAKTFFRWTHVDGLLPTDLRWAETPTARLEAGPAHVSGNPRLTPRSERRSTRDTGLGHYPRSARQGH
jgi:site-specific recombinase XerD